MITRRDRSTRRSRRAARRSSRHRNQQSGSRAKTVALGLSSVVVPSLVQKMFIRSSLKNLAAGFDSDANFKKVLAAARRKFPHLRKVQIKSMAELGIRMPGGAAFDPFGVGKAQLKRLRRVGLSRQTVIMESRGGRRSSSVLAHELGHLAWRRGRLRGLNSIANHSRAATMKGSAGMASLLSQPFISRVKDRDTRRKLRAFSGVVPLIAGAPMLIDEAAASLIGRKFIKKAFTNAKTRSVALSKFRKLTLPAFATYLTMVASVSGLPFLSLSYYRSATIVRLKKVIAVPRAVKRLRRQRPVLEKVSPHGFDDQHHSDVNLLRSSN